MHISKFQLNNYKSYLSSPEIELSTGFNVIVGRNNAGKTTLLDSLRLNFQNISKPHRSLETLPSPDTPIDPNSRAEVSISISRDELLDIHNKSMKELSLPIPTSDEGMPFSRSKGAHDPDFQRGIYEWVLSHETFTLNFRVGNEGWTVPNSTSFGLYEAPTGKGVARHYISHIVHPDGTTSISGPLNSNETKSDFGFQLIPYFIQRIYSFRAERVVGRCEAGGSEALDPTARNLAEVLDNLQRNPPRFQRFNKLVQSVLPQILHITVQQAQAPDIQTREVVIWPVDPVTERLDLTVPLSESGTGIGQVLAILYVVFTSTFARTILIDEPQSFLHPGAVRRLIEILRMEYPQHQYILATHSPTVITASTPKTITLVKQLGPVSTLQSIDASKNEALRDYLAEIGASLSDVFGADNILWVEGPTEEICFPMILQKVAKLPLLGTAIIGVKHTGDLEGKQAKKVYEIYDKLSKASGLIPPAIGFIFDREGRSKKEREDIERMSGGLATFLPRRLYENYLLNPDAIAAVANSIEGFRRTSVTAEEIRKWFDTEGKNTMYGRPTETVEGEPQEPWIIYVHGAKLLNDLFSTLSEARVTYVKTEHSVKITEWLIENAPQELTEVIELISDKLHNPLSE
ncbi:MAG TPA: AAA family ATPase [Pyrinomonadaceae bacterium]|jgi:energy-coupling factor transporter ATP-binding protein EcfA2|nr:AAA family ATPase [Pyrinomonadaceae bacterium]